MIKDFNSKKLNEFQIAQLSCASVRLEGLPLPEGFEDVLEAYNKGFISKDELLKMYGV